MAGGRRCLARRWGCAVARQSPSRLMSIMRASLSGLTISHVCLSALPSERKEVPTTAQTALRRRKVQSSAPVDADPAPPPPAPEGALPPRIGQALAQLGKPPPRPASVSARSTDCIFYLSQGLSGQLAAGCAAAQPQYHIPPIPYYLRRGSHGVGTGDGRRDRRGIAQSAMT